MRYKIATKEFPELKDFQKFGVPRDGGRIHEGIDLCNGSTFDLLPWKGGNVEKRKYNSIAGYSFWIHHGDGTKSLYCHITEDSYKQLPNKAIAGQKIAVAGRTGNATAIVCHYEYHVSNKPVNPYILVIEEDEMSKIVFVRSSWNAPIRNDAKKDIGKANPGEIYRVIGERDTFKAGNPTTNKEYKIGDNQWLHGADVDELTFDNYIDILNINHRAELTDLSEQSKETISELTDQVEVLRGELEKAQISINFLKQRIIDLESQPIEQQGFDIVKFILSLFKKS